MKASHYQPRDGLAHGLDPRAKLVMTLLYILTVGLIPAGAWRSFGLLLTVSAAGALLTGLGLLFAMRRAFVAVPFVLAALPLPFTMPGPTVWTVPLLGWHASYNGAQAFLSIVARTWLSVQAAILLGATTRFADILWGLGKLGVPRPLVATVFFMYRYLTVLSEEATRMLRARAARSSCGGRRPSIGWQGRIAGLMVGSLLLRALERSERIYAAMLSRGFDGRLRTLQRFEMVRRDWGTTCLLVLLLGAVLYASYY